MTYEDLSREALAIVVRGRGKVDGAKIVVACQSEADAARLAELQHTLGIDGVLVHGKVVEWVQPKWAGNPGGQVLAHRHPSVVECPACRIARIEGEARCYVASLGRPA